MQDYTYKDVVLFSISIVFSMMLLVLPLPQFILIYRPNWIFLMLVFWLLYAPGLTGLIWFWVIGLFQDVIQATPFGMHALSYLFLVYVLSLVSLKISRLPMWQQVLFVFCASFLVRLLCYCIQALCGFPVHISYVFGGIVVDAALWPWVYWLMFSLWGHRLQLY